MDRDTLRAAVFVVIVIGLLAGCLSACGGGVPQRLGVVPPAPVVVPPAVPPSTPAPPPPPAPVPTPPAPVPTPPPPPPAPVTLPTSYALTILPPVSGGSSAQAEAINSEGSVVGWSVRNGTAIATAWTLEPDGTWSAGEMGEGFALAQNDGGQAVGYMLVLPDDHPQAMMWPGGLLPLLPAYDSSEATGIDDDGTIVGVAFVLANPSIQQGWKWTLETGMVPLENLQSALAIRKGIIVGIGNNVDASTETSDLGLQGAATAVSSNGSIAGFTFGTTQGFVWTGTTTLLGTAGSNISLAVGINAQGIAVGQVGNQLQSSVRLARRAAGLPRRANFVGSTRAMAWDQTEGVVDLNSKTTAGDWSLVFSTGINDEGSIVGAAVNSDTLATNGFLLEVR